MRRVALIIALLIVLSSCSQQVSEVVEKYDNGNWKRVIVYKVKGDQRVKVKAIEYYENGEVKHEIDLRKVKDYTTTDPEETKETETQSTPDNQPAPEQEIEYQGPYADMMNQPGAVTRKLEGEEKDRVLEAMRKRKEEQEEGEEFTEYNEDGEEITKIRQVMERYEDGTVKHEQIFVKEASGAELEKDIEYYANGQVRTYVPYLGGVGNGKWLNYYRDGKLKTEGYSRNGEHHGEYTQYYESGLPMMRGLFKAGKMDGLWEYYWENGNKKMQTTFLDDKEIGPMQRFDEEGEPIKHQSPFRVGEKLNLDGK
jgi:antitoxin component YwqK of YwqJK toxin-antitoxin module